MALASSHGYSVLTRGNIWDKNVLLRARDRPSASPADIAMGFYRALADGNRQERYDAGEVVIFTCLYVGDKEDRLGALKWMNSASGSKIFIDLAGPDAGEEGVEKLQRETMLHLFDLLYKALDQGGEFAGESPVVRQRRAHSHERSHDEHAHLRSAWAVEHVGRHDRTVLGEDVGQIPPPTMVGT